MSSNFLDVGGTATKERVSTAFQLILSDKNVKGILVNIFGGIVRCDLIAQGIIDAIKERSVDVPLVVRLQGNQSDYGKELLNQSGKCYWGRLSSTSRSENSGAS